MRTLIILLTSWLPLTAHAQPCEVWGETTIDRVRVSPAGGEAFDVAVVDSPVVVRVEPRTRHTIEVRGELSFEGTAADVPFRLRRHVLTAEGMISLAPSAPIDRLRASGGSVNARVELMPAVHIRAAPLPCADIGLRGEALESDASGDVADVPIPTGDGSFWRPATRTVVLRAEPGRGRRVHVDLQRGMRIGFERVESQGPWMRVVWSLGATWVSGWLPRSSVRSSGRHLFGSTGGHSVGSCLAGVSSERGRYQGPAQVRLGALVRYAPHGVVWAAIGQSELHVDHRMGEAWARVRFRKLRATTPCEPFEHAWVRVNDVVFPAPVVARLCRLHIR